MKDPSCTLDSLSVNHRSVVNLLLELAEADSEQGGDSEAWVASVAFP